MSDKEKLQKLIDLCFEIGLTISDTGKDRGGNDIALHKKSSEEKARWIAQQLRLCGFDTEPVGSSWGVLKR